MNIIQCNILTVDSGIILHQVNCQKVAGAGLAKQIADKYPSWLFVYRQSVPNLGMAKWVKIKEDLFIVNLYAQENYGKGLQTDYVAFRKSLKRFKDDYYLFHHPTKVYLPFKIGCGLAGGNWDVVSKIIEEELKMEYFVCQLN